MFGSIFIDRENHLFQRVWRNNFKLPSYSQIQTWPQIPQRSECCTATAIWSSRLEVRVTHLARMENSSYLYAFVPGVYLYHTIVNTAWHACGSKAVHAHTMIAHGVMGSRGINPLFLDLSMRWRWVVTSTPEPLLLPGVKNLGGCKSLVCAGNCSLDHSICRLVTILTYLWEWLYPRCSICISDEFAEGIWRCRCSIILAETACLTWRSGDRA